MSDYSSAEPNFRRALDLFRELQDRANEAVVLNGLGGMLEKQERYPEALAVALDALRMLKAAGHWWTQATLENGVGWLYAHLGQYDDALSHCQRALSLHRESGHRGGAADTLDSLGYVYLHLGDPDQAQAHYLQAIDAYREIGAPFGEGNSLAGLGDVLLRAGDPDAARTLYLQGAAILDALPHPLADVIRGKLDDLDQAQAHYLQAIDAYREIGAPFGEGNSLAGLGDVLLRGGDPDAARALYLQAAAILDALPHPLADVVRSKLEDLDLDPDTPARSV